MTSIRYTTTFKKQFVKLPSKQQEQFESRLKLFQNDRTAPQLRVHPLNGKYQGYWSMNISGDLRALYRYDGENMIIFALIGTHSQLYS